jgi:hypothetical protein
MKTNVGNVERYFRIALGIFLMSLAFWGPANLWFLLGIAPVATGFSGWCPLYTMLRIRTCSISSGNGPTIKPQLKS